MNDAPSLYRPGVLRCAKCGFRLISSTLHVHSGAITPRETTEHCPNDGAPMWRVSWEEECREADRLWDEQFARADAAETRARELCAVLKLAGDFIEDEADNRAAAGSAMSDYEREPRELLERIDAALKA